MLPLLPIAFRNLLRAKRRNALSGGTMVLGTAALILGSGLSDGIARQLTASLVAVQTGHLQVVVRPDDWQPQNSPFDAYGQDRLPHGVELARRIEAEGGPLGVLRAVPYLHARGTAIAGNRSSLAVIVGIQPEREPELRTALPPEAGRFLPEGDALAVYIAAPMARKLRLGVSDSVSFVLQTPQGAINSLDAIVCGVFAKAAPWYDNTFYVPLEAAQALLDWPGAATNVKVTLRDGSLAAARAASPALESIVARMGSNTAEEGARIRVEPRDRAGRFSYSIIEANQTALAILSGFLFAAAAVGIVNAMLMSVHERTREIGTIRALGLRRAGVVRLFLLEGFALGSVAAGLGILVGGAVVVYLGARGIVMNTITLAWMAGGDRLIPVLEPGSVARAALAIVLLSTLAAVYPARVASRLEPREALQHV
ncbi:MAG TPA: FtsX-like permease family protein [Vicinamibacteria bacterium]|nr:FtsX-like permease family protein [Vicinamibacteria bacterium]